MPTLLALIAGAFAGYLPQLVFGDHLSVTADLISGMLCGTIGYAVTSYYLKRLRGD